MKCIKVEPLDGKFKVYDLTVDKLPVIPLSNGVVTHNCLDAINTYRLHLDNLKKHPDMKTVFLADNLAAEAIRRMEHNPVLLDKECLQSELDKSINKQVLIKKEIYALLGYEINLNSNRDKAHALLNQGEVLVAKTATGQYKVSIDELEKLPSKLARLLVKYSKEEKYLNSYLKPLYETAVSTKKQHYNFFTTKAPTGRLASGGDKKNEYFIQVNVQSTPKPHQVERKVVKDSNSPTGWKFDDSATKNFYLCETAGEEHCIRRAFIPEEDSLWASIDYSAEELRIAACLSGERVWLNAFKSGEDLHMATAKSVFGPQADKNDRKIAKSINFLCLYGGGARTLAHNIDIPVDRAQQFIDIYKKGLPTLARWQEYLKKQAKKQDISTYLGRKRRMSKYYTTNDKKRRSFGDRTALNSPVQGCLQTKSKILTNKGYYSIEELLVMDVTTLQVWDGIEWCNFNLVPKGEYDLSEFELSTGNIVYCDTRHEVLSYDGISVKFRNIEEIYNKGYKVCLPKPKIVDFLSVDEHEESDYYFLARFMFDPTFNYMTSRASILLDDKEVSLFKDYCHKRDLPFTVLDISLNKRLLVFHEDKIYSYYKDKFSIDLVNRDKEIPKHLFKASLKSRKRFLDGVKDSKVEINSTTYSYSLYNDYLNLLEVTYGYTTSSEGLTDYLLSGVSRYETYGYKGETYTLEVFNSRHQFVCNGVINKNTGADVLKLAFCKIYEALLSGELDSTRVKLIHTVHDEINYSVKIDYIKEFSRKILPIMRMHFPKWEIPFEVDLAIGYNWADVISYKFDGENFTPKGTFIEEEIISEEAATKPIEDSNEFSSVDEVIEFKDQDISTAFTSQFFSDLDNNSENNLDNSNFEFM